MKISTDWNVNSKVCKENVNQGFKILVITLL